MPTPTQSQSPPPAGYTGMDDVLIPTPSLPVTIQSETYPFSVISSGGADDDVETATRMYITSESFKTPMSTPDLTERWITRHADPKSKFKLLSRAAVESAAVPPVLDEKDKVFSPPYMLTFESQAAQGEAGNPMADHSYSNYYRQMFYFLPVSANQIFTARAVRRVKYFDEGFPQFEPQYEHFLATLKRDTITPQSTLKGSKPRTRRFYTAYFSFEIFLREADGGNQWLINKTSAKRTDLWHTPQGDIVVVYELISGYDFEVDRKNQRLMLDEKGVVKNLGPVVRKMDPEARIPDLHYLQPKWGALELFGHREESKFTISIELFGAYKTGKQFNIGFEGPPAAMQAHEPAIYAWLTQFRILQ